MNPTSLHALRDMPIRSKLRILVLMASGFALLLAGIGAYTFEAITFRRDMVRELSITARLVGETCAVAIEFQDPRDAETKLDDLEAHPHVVSACVYNLDGTVLARYARHGKRDRATAPPIAPDGYSFSTDRLHLFQPILVGGDRYGTLYLESDLEELFTRFRHLSSIGVVIFALSLLAGLLLAARLRNMIAEPILELASAIQHVGSKQDFSVRVRRHGDDELGHLIEGFNNMIGQLEKRDADLEESRLDLERRVEARTHELNSSQNLYASLVDALPMNVFRKDTEGRFTFCNQRFMTELGKSREQIIGHTDFDFFPPELARQYRADDLVIMNSNQTFETVESHQLPSGERTYVQVMKTPLCSSSGDVIGIQGLFWDVTDRKRAEEALAHEQDLLRALLDSSPDSIYFKDANSRFIKCSRAMAARTVFKDPSGLIGKSDFDLFTESHARPAFEDEQRILRTGQPILAKVERETWQDGQESWVLTTKMALRDRQGQIMGTFGVSRDITELKRAEAKLEATHKQLLDASRHAGMAEVATGVLHNVGNVLNSVNVSTTLIGDTVRRSKISSLPKVVALLQEHTADLGSFITADPRGRQLPGFIIQLSNHLVAEQQSLTHEVESLKKNVEHIRDIVSMQQSYAKMAGLTEMVSVQELVDDALRINAGALVRHDIQVERDFKETPPIATEKHKVLQILVNLIRNAKYACDEGRATDKRLALRVWNGDGKIHISVEDNGIGIPAENLTRIFGHGFTTRKEGHGFGLHSAALAAREMGGSLTARSEGPGCGATFTLELPVPKHSPTHD
jgi:PAS domain S-box-containing protein